MNKGEKKFSRVKLSKFLSLVLRHKPWILGLELDEEGFVPIKDLIEALKRKGFFLDEREVFLLVERDEKGRFEISGGKIRARYGHSIPVRIDYPEEKNVRVLYHGTPPRNIPRILKEGLKPMKRVWVHMSPSFEEALRVGLRRSKNPVVLEIDVEKMRKLGLKVYRASPKVFLSKEIPPECIRVAPGRGFEPRRA